MEEIRITEEQYDRIAQRLFEEAMMGGEEERLFASKYLTKVRVKLFPDSFRSMRFKTMESIAKHVNRIINQDILTGKPELKDTVEGMLSDDYRERFIAEFRQAKIRYKKLKKFCNKIEAAKRNGTEEPKHKCPLDLLREQQKHMGQYLYTLEVRAEIEGIELP